MIVYGNQKIRRLSQTISGDQVELRNVKDHLTVTLKSL
jgi:hypothetical protein